MDNKITYIFSHFEQFYDIRLSDYNISYGKNTNAKIYITQSELVNIFKINQDIDTSKIIFKTWLNKNIPFVLDYNDNDIFTETNNQIKINFDIIGAAFYLLSGWDEFISKKTDNLGRHTYKNSIQSKLKIIDIPVVNYYYDILKTAIEKAYNIKINYRLKKPVLCLTHDIDNCQTAWAEAGMYELKKGHFFKVTKLILKRFFTKDDWFNFDKILEIEKQFGAKSSFYFLPQKGKTNNDFKNADYNIKSKKIQQAMLDIQKSGSEVGIHSAFNTHLSIDNFKKDLQKFKEKPLGGRFHFLMYNNPKTVTVLEKNDIKYDSTLGYSEHIGFRNSTAFPFYIYNLQNDKPSQVLEIPLNIMDATLYYKKYMQLEKSQILEKVNELLNETIKFNGILTLLWHNNFFSDYKYKGWKNIYIDILKSAKQKNFDLKNIKIIYNNLFKSF
ncbi:MAG: hypothetical protein DRI94_06400 [Bacteroidetes bacterium]|nr:MAG: hypothetical protein DRI94_06400 [Bacteroidota bacterium]